MFHNTSSFVHSFVHSPSSQISISGNEKSVSRDHTQNTAASSTLILRTKVNIALDSGIHCQTQAVMITINMPGQTRSFRFMHTFTSGGIHELRLPSAIPVWGPLPTFTPQPHISSRSIKTSCRFESGVAKWGSLVLALWCWLFGVGKVGLFGIGIATSRALWCWHCSGGTTHRALWC